MEHFEQRELCAREQRAFDLVLCEYIDAGLSMPQTVSAYWLPNTHYILSNPTLGAVGLSPTHPTGNSKCCVVLIFDLVIVNIIIVVLCSCRSSLAEKGVTGT